MWPFLVTFMMIDIYMIEQLGCLYIFFISYDELASMKWGKRNNRGKKKEKETQWSIREEFISFSFLSRLFSHLLRNGRKKKRKEYMSFSSLILILSVYLFLDIYIYIYICVAAAAVALRSLSHVSIIIHGTIHLPSPPFHSLGWLFTIVWLFTANMLNVIFCKSFFIFLLLYYHVRCFSIYNLCLLMINNLFFCF
jgi:hypothetical protein